MGYIKKGFMPQAFDQVAFIMDAGELSDVVETGFGYHIIRVLDKKPAGRTPFKEVRDFIKGYPQSLARPQLITKHARELRQHADIEIFLN